MPETPSSVATIQLLAEALGVSREAIRLWRQDPRFRDRVPRPRGDHRYNVGEWEAFIAAHGLAGRREQRPTSVPAAGAATATAAAGSPATVPEPQFPPGAESDWRKLLIREKVWREEILNGQLAGGLLVANELAESLGAAFVAIQNTLAALPERAAPRVLGLVDVSEITSVLREEIEVDQSALNSAAFLTDAASITIDLPSDPEAARLLAMAAPANQTAMLDLLAHGLRLLLQRIGHRAIRTSASQPAPPALPADEEESQA